MARKALFSAMAEDPTRAIVGAAPAIEALRSQILRLAAFDSPRNPNVPTVLLQGETGTGKGLVSRVLHASGPRARGPFIDVNCAAIPETMLEAELFGFEAGAFTDARRAKPGLFEAASGGTLFLDEIDALSLALQAKLLKAIEEKSIRRLGAVAPQQVDVKLVAATAKELRALVGAGTFRADLYHRLAVVILVIPPLRQRRDDIVGLAEHFLATHAAAHGLPGKRLTDDARAWLLAHPWPGNVRELAHLMERVMLLGPDDAIDAPTLEALQVPMPAAPGAAPAAPPAADTGGPADVGEAERIRDALARAGGNVVRAARALGLGRNALRYRMRRLGIERPEVGDVAPPPVRRSPTAPASQPAAPATEPTWEQKPVAVLAIDIVFPETAETPAHEPWTLARRWETMLEDRVRGFGGAFVTRAPSRLTAVFGIPRTPEQLPARAVQAALAIQRLLDAEPPVPELRMAVHIGTVQTDTAAAEPLARLMPLGDTLALPERLVGHAGPGEILLSPAIARRAGSALELAERRLRVGTGDALVAYAIGGQRSRSAAPLASAESRFVGRERELAVLLESFASAAAGRGQVVFVVGEAGIGKSRLLAEFGRALGDTPHLWIEGRCASYGSTTPLFPIIDGLRRWLGIDDRDDEAGATAKVDRALAAFGSDLAWTLPFVAQILSLRAGETALRALDSASRRSESFRALKALLLRAAERQPVVLVVEDLHWIDPTSEELLTFIADALPTTRALLICSHRTGYRHAFGDRSYHVRVSLRALSSNETADLTGSLLGGAAVPEAVRALIDAKAEGNPFFVEEVTRSLLEDGSLRRENGRVVLARDLADIAVPDTIQDVLISRLDRLADDARHAIQIASVIGREFALRLLERITETGERVRTHLDELRAVELIYEKAAHPELAYMFKHALTHDVAYESVLGDRRRAVHRTIGLAIEELYAERLPEFYETLAHHFARAEEWERALLYHERAATKAAESYANRAVIAHCRQALEIADRLGTAVSDERRRALAEQLGLAAFYVSDFRPSATAFERAAEWTAPPGPRAQNLAAAALSHFWHHSYEASARANDRALALARTHGARAAEALAISHRGFMQAVQAGALEFEAEQLAEAIRMAEEAGDEVALGMIRFNMAQLAEWRGEYRRSIELSEQVIAIGRRLRLAHLVVWPLWFLGKAACCLGDFGRALGQLTEAHDICDRIGDRVWKSRLLNTLGWALAEVGHPARAQEYNARAAALAHEVGDPEIIANSEINLAANALALGDLDRALGHLGPIGTAIDPSGDPWMRWRYSLHARETLGRLALARHEPGETLAHAEAELAGAREHHVSKVEARALVLRGEALLVLERRDEAVAALHEAAATARRIAYPRAAWQALGLLAEARRQSGETGAAAELAAERDALVARAARSLADDELRRALR
jgi:DNA-binding NtrC family response regulator/tetratricopeptide (TPR) repeat protein